VKHARVASEARTPTWRPPAVAGMARMRTTAAIDETIRHTQPSIAEPDRFSWNDLKISHDSQRLSHHAIPDWEAVPATLITRVYGLLHRASKTRDRGYG